MTTLDLIKYEAKQISVENDYNYNRWDFIVNNITYRITQYNNYEMYVFNPFSENFGWEKVGEYKIK